MIKSLYLYDDHFKIEEKVYQKSELEKWYLCENKSVKEIQECLNVSRSTVDRILRFYGLHKDRKLASEIAKQTMLKKYGAVSYSGTEEYRSRYKNTCLSKYGKEFHTQAGQTIEKYKETCLDRYGVGSTLSLSEVKKKKDNACLLKYGTTNPMENDAVKSKAKETCLARYGVESYSKTEAFKDKVKKTCCEKYGVDSYSKTPEARKRLSVASLNRLEKDWSDECKMVLSAKENLVAYLGKFDKKLTAFELAEALGCSVSTIGERVRKWELYDKLEMSFSTSSYEKEIQKFLTGIGVAVVKDRKILNGLEIDLYDEVRKIGIEFNGTYWHSYSVLGQKSYHLEKSKLASEKGVRLIHIFEYEWNDPQKRLLLKSLLKIAFGKVDNKIYARKCIIKKISNEEARDFNDSNHLQGHRNAQVTYGLFYKEKLVQLMSFSKTKYNRNLHGSNDWEIIRGCPGSNNVVVGGVSKLFKCFLEEYKPDRVFSYCDFNKFDGKGYEAIGMNFIGYTGPDLKWIMKDRTVVNRQPSRHTELKNNSIDRIYGAGSKKYLWEKK